MRILVQPEGCEGETALQRVYRKAISEARELYVVTAFLTDWQPRQRLNDECEELCFIVGTDFCLTRKEACERVHAWLPLKYKGGLFAADRLSGFHPKVVMWKDARQSCHILIGSSNLTQAGLSTNYEANVLSAIDHAEYDRIREWVYSIREQCSPINEFWLQHYREMRRTPPPATGKKSAVVPLALPSGPAISREVRNRQRRYTAFARIRGKVTRLIRECAHGSLSNLKFYSNMLKTWRPARLQGRGFEIAGKRGNWQQVCRSLEVILDAAKTESPHAVDGVVKRELDRLWRNRNPNRGAWLSEMLCLFLPKRYPLLNDPVRASNKKTVDALRNCRWAMCQPFGREDTWPNRFWMMRYGH